MFDMNSVYKYQEILGERTIAENRGDGSFIWENSYDRESGINVYELALFCREKMVCMKNLRRCIIKGHILWNGSRTCLHGPAWSFGSL